MGKRIDLQRELEKILGSRQVYFQPPATIKMTYPAIIYKLAGIQTTKADNIAYTKMRRYTVTLIHRDPDNDIIDEILEKFRYCELDTTYQTEGLNHYIFNLYY